MKIAQRDVISLTVYDENGKKVVKLDSLKESWLFLNEDILGIKDALLDTDFLKFIGREDVVEATDFDKDLGKGKNVRTIVLGKNKTKNCKLIGKGYWRDSRTQLDKEYIFEIPNAEINTKGIDLSGSVTNVSEFDFIFRLLPFNEDGETIKIRFEE